MNFRAKIWTYNKDDGIAILGFLSEKEDQYVVIQNAEQYDEQDRKLGMDSHYLEINDQGLGVYNVIESVKADNNRIRIQLTPSAIKRTCLNFVEIEIDGEIEQIVEIFCKEMQLDVQLL